MRELRSAHVFCAVIDNFGDAGVCWRLSRALAGHGLAVTLWIDDLARLKRLRPGLDAGAGQQQLDGLTVRRWRPESGAATIDAAMAHASPADLVVAAFGCRLPQAYVERMAERPDPPVWLNLEYLSAEDWVERSHALPSPHPRLPLTEYFYFPGFTAATGGLLKEAGYDSARRAFGAEQRRSFLAALGVAPPDDALLVSLFCYPSADVDSLFSAMATGPRVHCLVPEGVTTLAPPSGGVRVCGSLHLQGVPFVEPDDYDRLLWSCDLNIVRGEDSAVRAQWAQRPMLWQLYPQQDGAHHAKLDAFAALYTARMAPAAAAPFVQCLQAWNGYTGAHFDWPALCGTLPALRAHAWQWAEQLGRQRELAAGLIEFARKIG